MSEIREQLPTLYSRSTRGVLRYWFMQQVGDEYRSGYGQDGSLPTYTGWTKAEPKNVGRANATTAEEQARAEILAEYQKKRDKGFSEDRDKAGEVEFVKPMLAHKFDPKRLEGLPWIAIQPKLDGIRCIITADGARTRNGKPVVTIPHIEARLAQFFDEDPELVLDGELYNHSLKADFNTIASLVRKQKPAHDDIVQAARMIEYHAYDVPSERGDYIDRHARLKEVTVGAGIDRVHTRFVHADNFERVDLPVVDMMLREIERAHGEFLTGGWEGTMIRLPAPYEFKRTHNLLKFKDFLDEEFEIVEVQEGNGNWAGYAKRIELKLPDGRVFGAGLKGNQEFARQVLAERNSFPGKLATVRYFNRTPDGVPRFPVVVALDPVDR